VSTFFLMNKKKKKSSKNTCCVFSHLLPAFWSRLEPAKPAQLTKDSYRTGPPGYVGWLKSGPKCPPRDGAEGAERRAYCIKRVKKERLPFFAEVDIRLTLPPLLHFLLWIKISYLFKFFIGLPAYTVNINEFKEPQWP
jgi:hypothetical protein